MSNEYIPHRNMRNTLVTTQAAVAMLLGLKEHGWTDQDYAMFQVMSQMWVQSRKQNPTYNQVRTFVGAWLRLLQGMINRLPKGDLKANSQTEFAKMSKGYEELLKKEERHERG